MEQVEYHTWEHHTRHDEELFLATIKMALNGKRHPKQRNFFEQMSEHELAQNNLPNQLSSADVKLNIYDHKMSGQKITN